MLSEVGWIKGKAIERYGGHLLDEGESELITEESDGGTMTPPTPRFRLRGKTSPAEAVLETPEKEGVPAALAEAKALAAQEGGEKALVSLLNRLKGGDLGSPPPKGALKNRGVSGAVGDKATSVTLQITPGSPGSIVVIPHPNDASVGVPCSIPADAKVGTTMVFPLIEPMPNDHNSPGFTLKPQALSFDDDEHFGAIHNKKKRKKKARSRGSKKKCRDREGGDPGARGSGGDMGKSSSVTSRSSSSSSDSSTFDSSDSSSSKNGQSPRTAKSYERFLADAQRHPGRLSRKRLKACSARLGRPYSRAGGLPRGFLKEHYDRYVYPGLGQNLSLRNKREMDTLLTMLDLELRTTKPLSRD